MTQPRKAQIKSVSTRYLVHQYQATPDAAFTSVPASGFPYPPGGADQDVPARVRGSSVGPFATLPGDSFSIRMNGAPAVNVILAGTDTTSGRVALKVNAAMAAAVASNDAGHLVLSSTTAGGDSELILADITPGTLAKFGIVPGTFSGTPAATDGLLTLSPDGFGGQAPHATSDGKNLVTDGGKLVYVLKSGSVRQLVQLLPGGVPVIGRTTLSGSNIVVSYFAKMIPRTRVRTFGSFFPLLDNTDSIALSVNGQGFGVTFPSGPYTRDQVIDLINAAYASNLGITDTYARADATVAAPYFGLNGSSFVIEVDGGSPQIVSFNASESSITEVVNRINAVVTGVVALSMTGVSGTKFLAIRSSNPNGRTSSLKIYAGSDVGGDQSSGRALSRIGLRAGFYGGCYVADQYGPDEIELFSAYRGGSLGGLPEIDVNGTVASLARFGVTVNSTPGATDPAYEPVLLPHVTANMSLGQQYLVEMAYPVVLEFGQVSADAERVVQGYLAKSAGSNVEEANRKVFDRQNGSVDGATTSRGFFDVGKPLVMAPDGSIPSDAAAASSSSSDGLIKQITRVSATEIVQAVVGKVFETPGNGSNPLAPFPYMRFDADPTDVALDRGFRFYVDPASIAFSVEDVSAGATAAERAAVRLYDGRSIFSNDTELRLADENVVASGDPLGYVRLSSPIAFDRFLAVGGGTTANDTSGNTSSYNLLRSVNSRVEVVVGDGTSSFGDFNGTDSLIKARDFLVAAGVTRCKIVMKPGSYSLLAVLSFSTSFLDVSLEGLYPITDPSAPQTVLTFAHGGIGIDCITKLNSFSVKNIKFVHTTLLASAMRVFSTSVQMTGCSLNTHVVFGNALSLEIANTSSTGTALRAVYLQYDDGAVPGGAGSYSYASVALRDCTMSSGQNTPIVTVADHMTAKQVRFRDFTMERCILTTGNASVSGQVILSSEGIGVLGIEPSVNALGPTVQGLAFQDINLRSLEIIAGTIGTTGSYGPSAIFISPTGTLGSPTWVYGTDPAAAINNVNVEDVNVNVVNGSFWATTGFFVNTVMIAGVGIQPKITPFFGKYAPAGGSLRIRGLYVNAGHGANGKTSTCMLPFFQSYLLASVNDLNNCVSGLIALSAYRLDVENVVVEGTLAGSQTPSLFMATHSCLKLDGFTEFPLSTLLGSSAAPDSRITFRDMNESSMQIQNINMQGSFNSDNWWFRSCVFFEAMSIRNASRVMSDFVMFGFVFPVSTGSHILLSTEGPSTSFFLGQVGGITIERGYMGMVNTGLTCAAWGINLPISTDKRSGNIIIRDVVVDSMLSHGISLVSGDQQNSITVERCEVRLCGRGSGEGGIYCLSAHGHGHSQGATYIRDNISSLNNLFTSGYLDVQINVRDSGDPGGVFEVANFAYITGNNCQSFDGGYGKINAIDTKSNNLPTVTNSSFVNVHGVETGFTGQTGSFVTSGNGRRFDPGLKCLFNEANLLSDKNNVS